MADELKRLMKLADLRLGAEFVLNATDAALVQAVIDAARLLYQACEQQRMDGIYLPLEVVNAKQFIAARIAALDARLEKL